MSEPFGPYLLEQRLAAGGMAEVFLARKKDGPDAKRWCVIKRMLPHIAQDPHFAAMFLDEAKLAAQLNHPGIAQLYDFGRAEDVLFLAMEYVAGATLRGVVKDHARSNRRIGFAAAAEIIARAADALDYAHRAADLTGKPLGLIHRDVSPQNILLSMKGEVKLIDFGVAKAATASQVTAEGIIKGKFPYMSPEQIRGQPLDPRSDLFGLGLVLYELIAGKRAITGATDVEISQNALAMRYAPIEKERPDIPPGLLAVLQKATEREKKKRYQTAGELAAALRVWSRSQGKPPTDAELAALLPLMERPPPPPLETTAVRPGPAPLAPSAVRPPEPALVPSFWDTPAPAPVTALDPSQHPTAMVDDSDVRRLLSARQPTRALSPAAPQPSPLPPPVPPPSLRVDDGPGSGSASRLRMAVRAATLPWILSAIVLAVGFMVLLLALSAESRRNATPQQVALPPPVVVPPPVPTNPTAATPTTPAEAPAQRPAVLTLKATPAVAVTVDGKQRGRTPLELSLPPGEHTVVLEDPTSGLRQTRKVTLKAGEARAEAWQRGNLSVRAIPWGEVFIDGESVGVTPLPPLELTAGKHQLKVTNSETRKENAREVEVFAGAEVVVKVDLR